jgi:hypothetical protein
LDVFEAGKNLMLDDKDRLHLVPATLLDGERLALQRLECAWLRKIDGDIWPTFDFLPVCWCC